MKGKLASAPDVGVAVKLEGFEPNEPIKPVVYLEDHPIW